MKFKIAILTIVAAFVSGAVAYAHHSFAGSYVEHQVMKIEGKVVEFNIRNPHSFILIEVQEAGKPVRWGGEWGGVTQLSQGGVTRFTLEVGDHLIIEGAPPRDSEDKKLLVRKVWRPATAKKPAWEWAGNVR
jgi:hypothetical protein